MKRGKSFDNLLTDLHSDPLPDAAVPALSLHPEGVLELSELTLDESERLIACEQTIAQGLDTFLAVGNALLAIQGGKLYRSTHRSFGAYCRERFRLKRQRAYELIGAAEVVNRLSEISDTSESAVLPVRESHARALADLPADVRQEVWTLVIQENQETQKPITATRIKAAADQHAAQKTPSVPADSVAPVTVDQQTIRQLKKALMDVDGQEVRLEIRGRWLKRHGLEDVWRALRNRPEWVINERFKDSLSLQEARQLGLLR